MREMRSARALGMTMAAAWVAAFAIGCMFIVDDELGTIHCLDEGAFGPPACPSGQVCLDGLCSPDNTASKLGSPCEHDTDCAPEDFCLQPALFGEEGTAVCARACCSSSECDRTTAPAKSEPFVCWTPDAGGGSFCRLASALGRGGTGEAKAGEPCTLGQQCRSGSCTAGTCADACCSDANCASAGARCQVLDGASNGARWSCAATPVATLGFLEPCASDAQCISGLCIAIADRFLCSEPCCDSTGCGKFESGVVSGQLACVDLPRHGSLIRACARVLPDDATVATGGPCTGDAQCRGGSCIESSGGMGGSGGSNQDHVCSDVCCVDADCGDKSTLACRPFPFGATWALRCELK